MPVTDRGQMEDGEKWKIVQYSGRPETTICNSWISIYVFSAIFANDVKRLCPRNWKTFPRYSINIEKI